MWQIILYSAISLAALYAFTATIFLFLARLEKNAEGKLVVDPDSWHFKVAYPMGRAKVLEALKPDSVSNLARWQAEDILASYRKGLCAYFFKFFFMLYLGWPFLAVFAVLSGVVFNFFTLPFGHYCRTLAALLQDRFVLKRYPLPRIYGIRLLPIYFIVPLLYGTLWYFFPNIVPDLTVFLLLCFGIGILAVVVIWAIVSAISWFRRTDEKSVNVVREWVAAKKEGVCPMVEIKSPDA